jgi:hypothetical protein
MKNKFILFLCLYLASAVLVLGLILPSFNSARQAVSNDNAAYKRDNALQIAHDNWLKSDEAAQVQQHNADLIAEDEAQYNAQVQQAKENTSPSNLFGSFVMYWPPQLTDVDALAWQKVGGYPPFNWQWGDKLRLSIDKGGLIRYENMFYIFALSSAAYWIIFIGLLVYLKQKDIQVQG